MTQYSHDNHPSVIAYTYLTIPLSPRPHPRSGFSSFSKHKLNKWLQLEPLPDDNFRNAMLIVLVFDIVAAFIWDRLMLLLFAPKILVASFEGTTWKDVGSYLRVMAICSVVIYFLATVRDADLSTTPCLAKSTRDGYERSR